METNAWKVMWREIRHDKLALLGLILFVVTVVTVYTWALTIDQSAAAIVNVRNMNQPPSRTHPLGTDPGGRDVLEQLVLSARNSFNITFIMTIAGAIIGILVGLLSGFFGGHLDNVLMRILDFYAMFPALMLIIVFISMIPSYSVVTFAVLMIVLWSWQGTARLIRIKTLQQGALDYVSASKTMGTHPLVISFREVLPNLVSIITSNFTLNLAMNMGVETGLTFLGFGLPFATPSLGRLIAYAQMPANMTNRPWLWLPAALLIFLMMLCVNFVGQALNRAADAKKRMV
ncbi:MAG: ABC transporter permease [Defluviitaleaceae bacterium]|nr:ABC transporter permease [Defluviitaleaceae bacterium]MCL2835838.1 ABC transporter permease [Defluviitaleaceae bacterium]